MKQFLILSVWFATLCLAALREYIWDETQLPQFAADDGLHRYFDFRGNDIVCALTSSNLGAGTQIQSPNVPPTAESRWNPKYLPVSKARAWPNRVAGEWGWRFVDPLPDACDWTIQGWETTLRAIGEFGRKDKWKCSRWVHFNPEDPALIKDQTYQVLNGPNHNARTTFPQTGAAYNHAFHQYGFLLFQEGILPAEAASTIWDLQNGRVDGYRLPYLRQQADFLWFEWQKLKPDRLLPNVYFCAVNRVSDATTLKLIARYILHRGLNNLEPWPAFHSLFRTDTPEGRALLGSPAAHQCVLFLMQHKAQMGLKYIPAVRVLRGPIVNTAAGQQVFPQLLFTVDDVPQHIVKPDPAPGWTPPGRPNLPPIGVLPPNVPDPLAPIPPVPQSGVSRAVKQQPGLAALQHHEVMLRRNSYISYEMSSHRGDDKNVVRMHTFHVN